MMLGDIDRDTVDWGENFDQSLKEPTVLPARLPALLVNGASGIAVGMATNIPPHNTTEICDAIVHLIGHPDASVDDLMQFVTGPDFPTGAHIWGREGIRNAYVTGRGRVMVQADHSIEDMARGERKRIVFNEIPFQVNKANLVAKIADLIKARKIEGISEVRDESDRKGMRIVLELRRGAHVAVVLNTLYKHTNLRNSFSVNMIALVDGTPRVLTLKQSLRHYIEFREQVVRRRAEFDLNKAKARLHVL
jgi:DNA gyrase subunit A